MLLSSLFFIIGFYLYKVYNHTAKRTIIISILFFLYLIFSAMFIVADYFTDEGINDAVVYHILYGLDGAGFNEYIAIISASVVMFILCFILSYIYYRIIKHSIQPNPRKIRKTIALMFIFCAFLTNPSALTLYGLSSEFVTHNSLDKQNIEWNDDDREFLSYYKNEKAKIVNEKNPNFIYIYAESLENTYFDESIFPNLMPGLKQIKNENTYFTNIHQITGSGWTVGGMTSSQCGIPLFTPSGGNSMQNIAEFYGSAKCIGDFLSNEEYNLYYRGGASLNFAGKGKLYTSHGFENVAGKEELILRLKDRNYLSNWGLYDDSLLDIVYEDYLKLSQSDTKFGIFALTLDTHHPKGHIAKSCENTKYQDGSNPMLNAAKCADTLLTNFVRKVQASKYGKNTIIVISSDHLAMKNTATDLLNTGNRKNLLVIIDPRTNKPRIVEKDGAMIDIATTLVRLLGYENDIGLGRNLLDDTQTLYEKFDNINEQLNKWSSSIKKFWNFSKLTNSVDINIKEKTLTIGKQSYTYPLILKIDNDLQTTPYFKSSSYVHASHHLSRLDATSPFVWVDECRKTNFLVGDFHDDYCLVYGKLGSQLNAIALSNNYTLDTTQFLHNQLPNNFESIFKNNLKKLPHINAISIFNDEIELAQQIPYGSSVYLEKHPTKNNEKIAYYKSIGLDPFQDLSKRDEFYFFRFHNETENLHKTHTIDAIIMKKWYYKYQNYFIKKGFYNREPKGSLFKATKIQ